MRLPQMFGEGTLGAEGEKEMNACGRSLLCGADNTSSPRCTSLAGDRRVHHKANRTLRIGWRESTRASFTPSIKIEQVSGFACFNEPFHVLKYP